MHDQTAPALLNVLTSFVLHLIQAISNTVPLDILKRTIGFSLHCEVCEVTYVIFRSVAVLCL